MQVDCLWTRPVLPDRGALRPVQMLGYCLLAGAALPDRIVPLVAQMWVRCLLAQAALFPPALYSPALCLPALGPFAGVQKEIFREREPSAQGEQRLLKLYKKKKSVQ